VSFSTSASTFRATPSSLSIPSVHDHPLDRNPLQASIPNADLRPLKLATSIKAIDPSKRICQYEVPGGGVCRDSECEDVHLQRILGDGDGPDGDERRMGPLEPSGTSGSRVGAGRLSDILWSPFASTDFFLLVWRIANSMWTDDDTAEYLLKALPPSWRASRNVEQVKKALEDARGRYPVTEQLSFDERVADALEHLQ
jgi:hypothetical protein